MAASYVEQFTIRTADELDELEEALGSGELEAVVVDVPEGASAFQTAREFRHILSVARAAGVEIELQTDDPLRRELARILGFRLAGDTVLDNPVRRRLQPLSEPSGSKTFRIVRTDAPETLDVTADDPDWRDAQTRPSFQPWRQPEIAESDEDDDEGQLDDGSYSFVIHPPTARRPVTQPFEQQSRQAETIPSFDVWEASSHESEYTQPKPKHARAMRPLALLSLLMVVTLVGAMLVMFLLPTATIAVTPIESQVSASVTYGVALPGTNWDITIQPETVTTTLTFSGTIPTTGERFEPDASAHGVIQLTNAATYEILVPAGTVIASEGGIQFATIADIAVPASDPYGSLTIGSATVEVAAVAPGPDSNVEAETVYGQLDSGIYFLNRDPITGGNLRRVAIVSQSDIDTLTTRATADLDGKAIGAIDATLTQDQQLLVNTESRGQIQTTFNHAVGSDATSLKLDATLALSAQAYRLGDVHKQAQEAVIARLRIQAGDRVTVLDDSLVTTEPQPIADSNGTAFAIDAQATARAIIKESDLDAIRQELSGTDDNTATARIRAIDGVENVKIEHSPSWLGGRMPRLDSRIQIEVVDATRVSPQATSSRP